MGARPPANDADEPESIEFGIAALDARLQRVDLSFPATREDVESTLGDERVPYDAYGNAVAISDVLADVDRSTFDSRQDLLNAMHPVFEEYRTKRSTTVVQQIRAMLPF